MSRLNVRGVVWLVLLPWATGPLACGPTETGGIDWPLGIKGVRPVPPGARSQKVPYPIALLLPKEIKIDSFTGERSFGSTGGVKGVDVRVQAIDHYGDVTKAFGKFRFEVYQYNQYNTDHRGARRGLWEEDLFDPKVNIEHWDNIPPGYNFRLRWDNPIPVGQQFILEVTFLCPYTDRKFAKRVFVAGQ